ncbi:MAG: YeeE/YedE thiosulfate transporter family protein, partial [Sphaerochaeta sp.]|nr:YeeE/YedE thiosulfate transporter family protein [Sphaerochaeta sp.]
IKKVAGNVKPAGVNTAIGAFLFGIGAVIAGGCASGTLMRMGEGFAQQWLAFVFFVIGSMLGVFIMVPMDSVPILKGTAVFLPDVLGGWIPAVIVQFGLLALIYLLAQWWGNKKSSGIV